MWHYNMWYILYGIVCAIWYRLLEVQGSYNQAIAVVINHV